MELHPVKTLSFIHKLVLSRVLKQQYMRWECRPGLHPKPVKSRTLTSLNAYFFYGEVAELADAAPDGVL